MGAIALCTEKPHAINTIQQRTKFLSSIVLAARADARRLRFVQLTTALLVALAWESRGLLWQRL
jgi:hypothetical protein